jgi:ubiquinone/menaquinone biosynthesis C-methylase UbiE
MSVWGRIFAGIYDHVMAKTEQAGLGAHRRALLAAASGDVLEIGAGTGTNLLYYERKGLQTLTLTEPEKPMARRLKKRILERRPDAKLLRAPAEDLPFNDDSFDTVVATLVLCTVDDQPRALRELRRVLRPRGRLLFIEHVRSDDQKLARLQDRMMPINLRVAHGCHCNRPTLEGIRKAGFEVTKLAHDTLKHTPRFVQPLVVGVAEVSARSPEAAVGQVVHSSTIS